MIGDSIGNLNYYAADDSPQWHEALRLRRVKALLRRQSLIQMPIHAVTLLETEDEALARNALRGFLLEFEGALAEPALQKWITRTRLPELLKVARQHASPEFAFFLLGGRMTRRQTGVFLRREYGRRFPFVDARHLSLNKHLARLAWPQSTLFTETGYFRSQIEAYIAARWPLFGDDPLVERARFLCLAYGRPAPP